MGRKQYSHVDTWIGWEWVALYSVKNRTICHARDLWELARSCKHLRLLCLPSFACRAFTDKTLVRVIVHEQTTKFSRHRNVHCTRAGGILAAIKQPWELSCPPVCLPVRLSCIPCSTMFLPLYHHAIVMRIYHPRMWFPSKRWRSAVKGQSRRSRRKFWRKLNVSRL